MQNLLNEGSIFFVQAEEYSIVGRSQVCGGTLRSNTILQLEWELIEKRDVGLNSYFGFEYMSNSPIRNTAHQVEDFDPTFETKKQKCLTLLKSLNVEKD